MGTMEGNQMEQMLDGRTKEQKGEKEVSKA